jgi:2-dehydropantoate 2-reductase
MESKAGKETESTGQATDHTPQQDGEGEEDFNYRPDVFRKYASDKGDGSTDSELRRIHIIGTGSIGKLVAHSLRGLANPPPVTLIFHRYGLLDAWEKSKKEITIQDDEYKVSRGGFDVELKPEVRREHGVEMSRKDPGVYRVAEKLEGVKPHAVAEVMRERQEQDRAEFVPLAEEPLHSKVSATAEDAPQAQPEVSSPAPQRPLETRHKLWGNTRGAHAVGSEPIHNLIVTTKTTYTINSLASLAHRLSRHSTICFLQNGMGIIDDVNAQIFPDEATRPSYVQGIITHGVNVPPEVAERDPFFAVHAGHGTIALGLIPRSPDVAKAAGDLDEANENSIWAPSARYLLRTLTRSPVLCAVGFTPTELLQQQLEKLAVNSVLNPLTSLIDARNGQILYNFALTRTMRLLLAETSLVMRSLPELASIPNVETRFSAARLETLVVSVAKKTAENISSMLADVRAGRPTEINWINGYIVKRGDELGIPCVANYAIMQTVIGKRSVVARERDDEVPMARSSRVDK